MIIFFSNVVNYLAAHLWQLIAASLLKLKNTSKCETKQHNRHYRISEINTYNSNLFVQDVNYQLKAMKMELENKPNIDPQEIAELRHKQRKA